MESLIADTYERPLFAWTSLIHCLGWKMTKRRRSGSRNKYGEQVTVTTLLRLRYQHHKSTNRHQVCESDGVNGVPSDPRSSSRDTNTDPGASCCTVEPNPL